MLYLRYILCFFFFHEFVNVPSKGIASEVFGSKSATNNENTVNDSKMVIPGKHFNIHEI